MSAQRQFRRVNFTTSINETFTVKRKLDDELLKSAMAFWRDHGLTVDDPKETINNSEPEGGASVVFKAHGGSLWSRTFQKYRKIVTVNLMSVLEYTHVSIRIDLPGAYALSADDIRQATETIEALKEQLEPSDGS